jgi:hypothetical protein
MQFKTFNANDNEHIYYDVSFNNYSQDHNETRRPLQIFESRTGTVIQKSQDYYLTIARFYLETGDQLPCFIPIIKTGQTDPDLTIYKISMFVNGNTIPINIKWRPQNMTIPQATSPINTQEFSEYYYSNAYGHFIDILNDAISDACSFTAGQFCFFQIDASDSNVRIMTDVNFYTNGFTIALNAPLKNLLSTFNYQKLNIGLEEYFQFQFPKFGNPASDYSTLALYYISTITTPFACGWSPVSSVVFTSSNLPITQTLTSQNLQFATNSPSGQPSNFSNVLTDFEIDISSQNFYSPAISYESTLYRLIDLYGATPLTNFEISIYWRDRYNNLHPLYNQNNTGGNIKLLFIKKH